MPVEQSPSRGPRAPVRRRLSRARARPRGAAGARDGMGMEDGVASAAAPDVLDSDAAGGLVMAAGYVAGTLLSLVSFSVITRHLGVERFGDYQTALSVITFVSAITDVGM